MFALTDWRLGRTLVLLILLATTGKVFAQFGGGSGTAEDPYLIQTAAHLNYVRVCRTAHFLQTNSIDLNVAPYNQGSGWNPIGTPTAPFSGSYDGGCFTISGLYINLSYSLAGLFGFTSNAEITRVRLENASITASSWVGSLVGNCNDTNISSCLISSNVTGDDLVGGLAGIMESCNVSECQIIANVNTLSGTQIGGLCGCATDCNFISCKTGGTCSGTMYIGGIVGCSNGTTLLNSYSSMNLNSGLYMGGLVGQMDFGSLGFSYFNGTMSNGMEEGGLIADGSAVTVTNSYWDTQTSGTNTSDGGEGRTTAQMTYPYSSNTYVGWDFDGTWVADSTETENGGYPYLQMNSLSGAVDAPNFSHASGYYNSSFMLTLQSNTYNSIIYYSVDGTEPSMQSTIYSTPIAITETVTVKAFAMRPGWVNSNTVTANYYLGMYGGGNGTETDPYLISTPVQLYNVRYALDACFKQTQDIDMNVEPFNTDIGWTPIGNAVTDGYISFSGIYDGDAWKISNLYINTNIVYAALFGGTSGAELRNICLDDVDVNGNSYTAGLVGYCVGSVIERCSVSGVIHGNYSVGSLFGFLGSSNVSNCFSHAAVSGYSGVGGLVGHIYLNSDVVNCYSTGLVICSGSAHGGLIGEATLTSWNVSASYWNIETSGQSTSVAGIGKTTDEMTFPYAQDCYENWLFDNIWKSDEEGINGGYPYFYRRVRSPLITNTPVSSEIPVMVTISCETAGSRIFYTLDDSIPDVNSISYLEPFYVYPDADSIVCVKAIAMRDGFIDSGITSQILNFHYGSELMDGSNVAQVLSMSLYPNPTTGESRIKIVTSKPISPKIDIYNARGQHIRSLIDKVPGQGEYTLFWDGKDNKGLKVATGVYFIRLDLGHYSYNRKLIVIK
jgi:hypothetical protein